MYRTRMPGRPLVPQRLLACHLSSTGHCCTFLLPRLDNDCGSAVSIHLAREQGTTCACRIQMFLRSRGFERNHVPFCVRLVVSLSVRGRSHRLHDERAHELEYAYPTRPTGFSGLPLLVSPLPFSRSHPLSLQPRGRVSGSGDQVEPASIGVDPHQDKGGSPVPSPFRLRTTIVDAPNWRPPFLSTRVGHGGRNTSVARGGTGATASLCTTQETRRNEDERRTVQRTRGWDGSRHGREGRNT